MPPAAAAAVTAGIVTALAGASGAPRLLEPGVGTGRIALPLAAAGVRIVGVDVAPRMVARLRAKGGAVAVVLADAGALPFRPAVFDAALFVHLLHLVPDAPAAVRAARSVVRPGGLLLHGRTDYAASSRGAAHDLVRTLVAELGGPPAAGGDWHAAADAAFDTVVAEAGACRRERVLARWTERTTGRRLLDDLAARVYSSSWMIPEATMPELLARLAPRLAALLGGLDAPAATAASFTLVTGRLPP